MADICKCKESQCPKKDTCYRWLAESNPWSQSYFGEMQWENCGYYWKVRVKQ